MSAVAITARCTRLLRAPDLRTFQTAVIEGARLFDPWQARRTAILVATTAAAGVLRRRLEESLTRNLDAPTALVFPHLLTRDGWYREMHARTRRVPGLLSQLEREVCMLAAARGGAEPPFRLRPGLMPAVVGLYDRLMRHRRSIDAFDRLMTGELEPSVDLDRGARRLLRQTEFLVSTFKRYQTRVGETGCVDEHGLRALLTEPETPAPFTKVVVTIPDHVAEPTGLWPADYDLLTRLPGLREIDVVATDRMLDAGLQERLVEHLPGIEEKHLSGGREHRPRLVTPSDGERQHFVWRDREEELLAVARNVKALSVQDDLSAIDRVGVVFRRPLPYLYVARELLDRSGISSRLYDGLPLAAEPYAAAVDLVCTFVTSSYDRVSTVALLRSPHFDFGAATGSPAERGVELLDQALSEERFVGGREQLRALSERWTESGRRPGEAAAATLAAALAEELRPLEGPSTVTTLLKGLGRFLRRHGGAPCPLELSAEREERARLAIWTVIDDLAAAHQRLDRTPRSASEAFVMLRRWIEGQTIGMGPMAEGDGVHLVDPRAAAFGQFDELFIVGLVEGEWPDRTAGNIFYPSSLLIPLGWPVERDRLRAARAQFADLLELPRNRVSLSTISLENDTIVASSTLLDELVDIGLSTETSTVDPLTCVTPDDAMALSHVHPSDLSEPTSRWLDMRTDHPDLGGGRFHGMVGARQPERYAIGALERYLECPFKYLAERVLKLGGEPIDNKMSAAQRRGLFLHALFESFFRSWRDGTGGCSITSANLEMALERFQELAEDALGSLPPGDRSVTRSWMLGSAAAAGLAERLFLLEVGHPAEVVERLTEFRVDGTFVLDTGGRGRVVRLRGIADRIDLFSDGTFRVVDYKANRAPARNRALQLPLYTRCAEQQLAGHHGRDWRAVEAAYAAFGEPRLQLPIGRRGFAKDVAEGERRAVAVLDRIERGDFPVQPAELFRCSFCAYPTVCRKDYVGDD